ncbi:V-type proton ATPase subunit G 1-like [Silene latifolia]|uniref:V-type proton ATPase subunit G 1-like n=1 Tax=Silene latifolia TaxID=37657 RepID=UPI003D774A5C
MDSFKGQEGIQMLLAAEQEAQQIVTNARNLKMQRLKQAKDEADREIMHFRSQLEKEYQNKISESSGQSGSTVKRLENETQEKIQKLKDSASRVTPDVVGLLLKYVTTIKS